jgi:hypothetical protein
MAGMMKKDDSSGHVPLTTSREPKGPTLPGGKGSLGDEAFMDAIGLVIVSWAILFFLTFSLRAHSV